MSKGQCEHCKQEEQTLFTCDICGAQVCSQCTSELYEAICMECEADANWEVI